MSFSSPREDILKLTSLRELPKSRYATELAVTVYPNARRGRKAVFSHIEVYKMVENVAGRMRESGVRPGTVCAYALPTSFESIVFFFALMWIGAIAAPLDPTLSSDMFEAAVARTGAAVLVLPYEGDDEELAEKGEAAAKSLGILCWHIHRTINTGVVLETHSELMGTGAAWAGGASDFKIDPDEIALHVMSAVDVVTLSHHMMCIAAKSFVASYGDSVSGNTIMAAPLHGIHGLLILVSAFYSGGHVVLPGLDGFTPNKFSELAKPHQLNWLSCSEEQFLELYENAQRSPDIKKNISTLGFLRVACANGISGEVLQSAENAFGTDVFLSYGPAECAGLVTSNPAGAANNGSVGAAVENCRLVLIDAEEKTVCPAGVEGSIFVSGENVTQAYFQSPDATQRAVFETEEDGEDGEPLYATWFATGDLGTMDVDGNLTVTGNALAIAEERARAAAEAAEAAALAAKSAEDTGGTESNDRSLGAAAAVGAGALGVGAVGAAAGRSAARDAELEALRNAGIPNPDDLDPDTAQAILRRLEAIELNHKRLQDDLETRNAQELEDMRLRVAEAENEAARVSELNAETAEPIHDVRMEELEAAVMAAAASAESSANNTREAVKAAREVAEATHGTDRSREVDIKASTGDQGALTKTVRVALDEVENALERHPAVSRAKAFGRKDQRFGAEVFCAIVPKRGARVSEPWLKLFAQSQLPAPMVPKKFYYLKEIPDRMTRRELSESPLLKDLSAFAGYCETKKVKGPNWAGRGEGGQNALGF